jgi:hypothetical protein
VSVTVSFNIPMAWTNITALLQVTSFPSLTGWW